MLQLNTNSLPKAVPTDATVSTRTRISLSSLPSVTKVTDPDNVPAFSIAEKTVSLNLNLASEFMEVVRKKLQINFCS